MIETSELEAAISGGWICETTLYESIDSLSINCDAEES